MSSPKRLARIAGLLYLIIGIFGSFAIAYVTAKVYVPGDIATTAGNVLANSGLVRIGVIAHLLQATVVDMLTAFLVPDVARKSTVPWPSRPQLRRSGCQSSPVNAQ